MIMSRSQSLFYLILSICLETSLSASPLCLRASWYSNATIIANGLVDGSPRFSPWDIALDSQQNIIIADWQLNRIQKYFKNGTIKTLVANTVKSSIFVDGSDNIYFTNDTMVKMLKTNGSLKTVAGNESSGSALNQLKWASGIYVDQRGTVYVADGGNFRVMRWESNAKEGTIVGGGKGQGMGADQLFGPKCLFVDELNDNTLYVCDVFNFRIQKFTKNSLNGTTVINKNTTSVLDFPSSIFVDSNGVLYISQDKGILRWFSNLGRIEVVLAGHVGVAADRFRIGSPFKFDKSWNIFLADASKNLILKYLLKKESCPTGK